VSGGRGGGDGGAAAAAAAAVYVGAGDDGADQGFCRFHSQGNSSPSLLLLLL